MKCPKCGSTNNTPIKLKNGRDGARCDVCGCKMVAKSKINLQNVSDEIQAPVDNEDTTVEENALNTNKITEQSSADIKSSESVIPVVDAIPDESDSKDKSNFYEALFPKISDDIFCITGIDLFGLAKKAGKKLRTIWNEFKAWAKQPFSIAALVLIVFMIVVVFSVSGSKGSASQDYINEVDTQLNTTNSNDKLISSNPQPLVTVPDEDITEIDYSYLYNHADDYIDKSVRIAGEIKTVENNTIKFKVDNDNTVVINVQEACDLSALSTGTYATIVGKVSTKGLFLLTLNDGYIEKSGDDSKVMYENLSAKADKLIEAEKAAEAENEKKKKTEYINSCENYTYKEIARNPNDYEGKRAKFTGEVIQVQEGTLYTILRVDVTKNKYGYYDDTMYVIYFPKSDSESRILEDDIITMYGELAGIKTYESVTGASISIPQINAEYIEIH